MTIEVPVSVVMAKRALEASEMEFRAAQLAFAKEARWWIEIGGGTATDLGSFLILGIEEREAGYYVRETDDDRED